MSPAMARTIMIMAGGTGGHIFPALSVAQAMRESGWKVVWLGARSGMEANLVPRHGYEMEWVNFSGLRGKGPLALVLLPSRLLVAFWQAARAIFRRRPDVVLGMGGYVAFPGGMMASLFRRPLVIHEQNSVAGLTNKVLARLADRVLSTFPGTLNKAEVTGNPVRAEIGTMEAPEARYAKRTGPLRILVVGGSLGAKALNDALPRALALIPAEHRPLVTHQSGARHLDELRAGYAAEGVQAEAAAFIDDMANAYANADLVICRSGATTVAELAAVGVASVLVPYPHAVDDHQTGNARFLANEGAAILLPQSEISAERLAELIKRADRPQLLDMARRARALGRPQAGAAVARVCAEAAGRGGRDRESRT
jgi:UDP-N-acetylglucosamine--N-acetylmuramyl-(pentapeptide) pyrophosphoryl-undecaprenol N-acetylglucosamine transferase